jgi:hypothetical protein
MLPERKGRIIPYQLIVLFQGQRKRSFPGTAKREKGHTPII